MPKLETMYQNAIMKKTLFLLLTLFSLQSYAITEGVEYRTINPPVAISDESKIEVKELFWYFCPHCHNLLPYVKDWLTTIKDDVTFIEQPAVFSERWLLGALFFYTLEKLDLMAELHEKLFDAIHVHRINLNTSDRFVDWLVHNKPELTPEQITAVIESFSMRTALNKAHKKSIAYGATGVPSFIINGKYLTSASIAGSEKKMFEVIDELVERERKRMNLSVQLNTSY